MKYDLETLIEAMTAGISCMRAIEEEAEGSRIIAGPDGPYAAEVLIEMAIELETTGRIEPKGK